MLGWLAKRLATGGWWRPDGLLDRLPDEVPDEVPDGLLLDAWLGRWTDWPDEDWQVEAAVRE